jgi:hypothetical protein
MLFDPVKQSSISQALSKSRTGFVVHEEVRAHQEDLHLLYSHLIERPEYLGPHLLVVPLVVLDHLRIVLQIEGLRKRLHLVNSRDQQDG